MKVIGVDSSTQSVKVVVRDAGSGELLASASRPHPSGTEVDPAAWWKALQSAIDDVGGLTGIGAIAIAGQQHGMVVLDEKGEVIRRALLWNDTRSSVQAEALNNEFSNIHERTGSRLVASFTASKLRWLHENEPENAARVRAVALPHEWLSWKLSGSQNLADLFTDRSDASGTGYFNPVSNEYDFEILRASLGSTDITLPRVMGPGDVGFEIDGLLIAPGMGDNAGAALGIGAKVGDLVISLGTSGTAFAVASIPTHDPSGIVAGFADATGNFLPLACTLNAATVFDGVASSFGFSHEEFSAAALAAKPGADGVRFLPHFAGERTPNRPDATGRILGLNHTNFTKENICRAAIEGVIAGLAYAVEELENLGVKRERILLVGGASRSEAVQQIASELFNQEIIAVGEGEYVADGAAKQAAWALTGRCPDWQLGEMKPVNADHDGSSVRESYIQLLREL